ncbi:hypothetical protein [Azospirillum thermophilum]|uniref:DUF4434 domain-containing protein n=1 Tax=Azospirillum thermophilum TaxID=2202148 RepID=A0A2S2CUD9_9PROT|nr:hypothetical protein [Azospirillum thermophilum]AWK88134.1 hypothetical protein DEW08_18580 [Azospirillum thermophilum]
MTLSRRTLMAAPLAAAAALAAGDPGRAGAAAAGTAGDNALWIWNTGRADWPRVAGTMRREGFGTAYLSIPPADRAGMTGPALDAALATFAGRGITVLLVGGDPGWADGRAQPPALAELLRLAAAARGVAGVQLDIEPYTLPLWKSGAEGRARIAAALADRLAEARGALSGSGKRLGMVLHPAFANAPGAGRGNAGLGNSGLDTLADAVAALSDELVVMAYRNRPDATERFAARLLASLDAAPKPWRFGVTVQGGPEQATISYADAPYQRVKDDMAALDTLARARPAGAQYRGVAVHAWASLAPKLER